MNIRQMCGDIRQREILLYGEQDYIILFLEKFCSILNVKYVLTDYKDEVRLQSYLKWDIETVMIDQADLSGNQMIVICAKDKFAMMKKHLHYMKKKEYIDYISCELVESLLYEKKLMVCMGTHLLQQVYILLYNSESIRRQYSIIFYREDQLMELDINLFEECVHISRYSDIYVRSACEKERFHSKVSDGSIDNKECKIITIADFGFGGYYPQIINDRSKVSPYLLREYDYLPLSYETLAFSRMDIEVVKLCQKGWSAEAIIEELLNPNYYEKKKVQNYFLEQIERFEMLETTADICLGDYIRQHKGECLCRNLNEWSESMVSYVAEELLQLIDLPMLDVSKERRIGLIEENSGSEIVIYPSVQNALGLESILKNKKYKVNTYYQSRYMTMEEYLCFMIEYIYRSMDIIKFTGMDDVSLYK